MKKTRRFAAVMLCLCLCCALSVSALADVIWVPENDFYNAHYDEMTNVVRHYYTNGALGYVTVQAKPGGAAIVNIPNGEKLYVSVSYTAQNGENWGLVEVDGNGASVDETVTGWVKMSDMLLVYDSQAFYEDHRDELQHPGDMCGLEYGKEYVLWAYPDSGVVTGTVTFDESWEFQFKDTYTDPDGRLWGYVGYYYGHVEAWICIDDPESETIPGQEIMTGELIPAKDAPEVRSGAVSPYVTAAVAGAVIVAAAVIIAVVLRSKKRRES